MLALSVQNLGGKKNIQAMKEINNKQLGCLEITYLSNRLRIWIGDKGTLFVFRNKINDFIQGFYAIYLNFFKNIN